MDELSLSMAAQEADRVVRMLRNLKPNPRCPTDWTWLTHVGGSNFKCYNGHMVNFRCPECGSPLSYGTDGFSCGTCSRRILQV